MMPFIRSFLKYTTASAAVGTASWIWYTRQTHFVPFDISSPDFTSPVSKRLNPALNKPVLIDHAVRSVPLSQLKTTDQAELTREFSRGVWGGWGFEVQRRMLERWYRHKEGKQVHLWDAKALKESDYTVGTKIADHFEVMERTPDKIIIRCGDSPDIREQRDSDGIFCLETTIDDNNVATFHMKSIFFNSLPNAPEGKVPWHIDFLHREYAKLWMETSVRALLK